jgi:hypothetical protein
MVLTAWLNYTVKPIPSSMEGQLVLVDGALAGVVSIGDVAGVIIICGRRVFMR